MGCRSTYPVIPSPARLLSGSISFSAPFGRHCYASRVFDLKSALLLIGAHVTLIAGGAVRGGQNVWRAARRARQIPGVAPRGRAQSGIATGIGELDSVVIVPVGTLSASHGCLLGLIYP
jgi:hypothetical protein